MPKSSAAGIKWNLSDLYASIDDVQIGADLKRAGEKAASFEKKYKPLISRAAEGADFDLAPLINDYIDITELFVKPYVFAMLTFSGDTSRPEHGALIQKVRTQVTEIKSHCLFWELTWSRLEKKHADTLSARPEVSRYRHYLEQLRLYAPHLLSEPEEKVIDIKDNTGGRAFSRLFDEVMNGIVFTVSLDGKTEEKTESEVLAMLHAGDRNMRKEGHRSLTEGLTKNARILTYIFNMILEDHRSSCKMRGYKRPIDGRNLANEISWSTVENLIESTRKAYPTVARYYRLKKRLLGLDTLYDYDRYAPTRDNEPRCDYTRAEKIIRDTYRAFSPEAGKIVDRFFDHHWIDAELRPGKQGGAFCCSTLPRLHSYVLTNYADKMRDVMTLAHELGHGVHQTLSRSVGILECDAPLTLAECASVFGEMLVFDHLMNSEKDDTVKLSLLCGKIEDCFATVFRQIVMTDFELKIHDAVAREGELKTERFNELWIEANRPMHGDAVTLTGEYGMWWMYIPHFIHTPFYCYAYAFAQLLVLSMYEKFKQEPGSFVPKYLELLSLGGSRKPEDLCRRVGLNIEDPQFWNLGLNLVDRMVDRAETLAGALHA